MSDVHTAAFVTDSVSAYDDSGATGTVSVPAEDAGAARMIRTMANAMFGMGWIISVE